MAQQRHEDSDDDSYVRVGSAFERLETEEDVQKAKARKEKESYVTDDQGRRRFHGAFTGGFSAGYFNTVGSKEGNCALSSRLYINNEVSGGLMARTMYHLTLCIKVLVRLDSTKLSALFYGSNKPCVK